MPEYSERAALARSQFNARLVCMVAVLAAGLLVSVESMGKLIVDPTGARPSVIAPGTTPVIKRPAPIDQPGTGDRGGPGCSVELQGLVGEIDSPVVTNTYELWGTVLITDPPATGELLIRVEGGPSQVFTAPFSSPESIRVRGLYADGAARTVEAVFTDATGCTATLPFTAPLGAGLILDQGYLIPEVTVPGPFTSPNFAGLNVENNLFAGGVQNDSSAVRIPINVPDKSLTNYTAFCTELGEAVALETYLEDYRVSPVEFASRGSGGQSQPSILIPPTGTGRVKAGMVRWLFDNHFQGTSTNFTNLQAAAFQLALWDITHDHFTSNNAQSIFNQTTNGLFLTRNQTLANATQNILNGINALNWSDSQWESYVSTNWHPILLESLDQVEGGRQDLMTAIPLTSTPEFGDDLGDLPAPYPTLIADNGARHQIGFDDAFLGVFRPESEANGQPSISADEDDRVYVNDEDGIRIMTPDWVAGDSVVFEVTVGQPGYLSGFIDFNSDGNLTQANVVSVSGPAAVTAGSLGDTYFSAAGVYEVEIAVPLDAGDVLATRWRITDASGQGGNSATGQASSGEIEDHIFRRIEVIDVNGTCGSATNNNPITLTAEVNGVSEVEFQYWQVGVSSDWTSAIAWDQSTNPATVAAAGPDQFNNEYSMLWNTLGFDYNDGQVFQIQVIGRDEFGNAVVDTILEINAATCATSGTPVTLAFLEARQSGRSLMIDWSTSSEIANAGFNVYGEMRDGNWVELNHELIASHVVDSSEPQDYSLTVNRTDLQRIFLEDIALDGVRTVHGPFDIGQAHGRKPNVQAIDWNAVAREHLGFEQQRVSGWQRRSFDPVRLLVDQDGVYRVTYEQLLNQGLDLNGVPVSQIGVTHRGQMVPIYTEASGAFGPGDFVEFHGRGYDSLYTERNVYQLEVDLVSPSRMSSRQGSGLASAAKSNRRARVSHPGAEVLVTSHNEQVSVWREQRYSTGSPSTSPWYDTRMLAYTSPKHWNFSFEIDHMLPQSAGRLDIQYWGMTAWSDVSPDHHVVVELNGAPLGSDLFDGQLLRSKRFELPARLLRDGTNTLTLRLPGDTGADWDIVSLDGFRVTYPRMLVARNGRLHFTGQGGNYRVEGLSTIAPIVYQIEGDQVTRISELEVHGDLPTSVTFAGAAGKADYYVSDVAGLLTPIIEPGRAPTDITSGTTDYLMISHPNFIDGLQTLVQFHESLGRRVRVVDVMDIYDQFNAGIVDAVAIRDYVRATASSMGYEHVLLVGGDTYDYKNNLGSNSISFIPSLYADTGEYVNFAPADALFVDLDGDEVPDLPIGRLPVRTNAELAEVIGKTLDYASRNYHKRAVLAADKQEPSVSFTEGSEVFSIMLGDDWATSRAYLDWEPVADARVRLMSAIDQGVSLTSFIGHSSYSIWTFDGLFSGEDVDHLANFGRPTAVVQYGCWNTYHVIPSYNTLGHRFMLAEDRGAAVVVGSTTWTSIESGQRIGERFMPLLTEGSMTIGQALTYAKQDLAETQPFRTDAILGWTILGDPAIMVAD